jgi:hypothetical protein
MDQGSDRRLPGEEAMKYLIWSWQHHAWWAPNRRGYTRDVKEAGRYVWEDAADITVDHTPPGEEVAVDESWAVQRGKPPSYWEKP